MVTYKGIDTSLYQGTIDWAKVKADGVEFAMIKASQGRPLASPSEAGRTSGYDAPFTDPRFVESRRGAGQAGLYWGCYHYLCARNLAEAKREAEYFVSLVKPYRDEMKLWAAVDVEDASVGALSHNELTEIVELFCGIVRDAGLRPMVYTNTNWLEWAKEFTPPAGVPIWQAHYGRADHPAGAKIWQYTDSGTVDGICGNVDMNVGVDIIGDANSDGKVNMTDAAVMLKRIAGWDVPIDEGQADVNDDGYVTLSDVSALLRRIAGVN